MHEVHYDDARNLNLWTVPGLASPSDWMNSVSQGLPVLEAYPVIPTRGKLPDAFAWVGLYKSFARAGFRIVDRTSANRPMVRFYL